VDLRNLENANSVSTAQLMLSNLHAEQARLHEVAEKKIAEQARYLDKTRASYENLSIDLQKAKLNAKGIEKIIAHDREVIPKAQLFLQDNERILMQE